MRRGLGRRATWALAWMVTLIIGAGESCSSSSGKGTDARSADTAADTTGESATPAGQFGCGNATCVIGESYCRHSGGGAGGAGGNGASNPIPVTDQCVPFAGCVPRTCACTSCSSTCTETATGAVTASCLSV
jgi:hypothetical protein